MLSKPYLVNGSTVLISGALGLYNEILQKKVENQQMQWHPILGQGSDLAAGAMFAALALAYYHSLEQKYKVKLLDWVAPAAAGTLCTVGELTGIMGDTFDLKDIAAYWLGAGIAYVIHRASATSTLEAKLY